MTLYHGSNRIGQIFVGSQRIKQVYHGAQLVWSATGEGEVIFEASTAGDSVIGIPVSGVYEIIAVGGGGGTVVANGYGKYNKGGYFGSSTGAAGGSGALAIGRFRLSAGQQLNVTVGSKGGDVYDQVGSGTHYITCDNGGQSKVLLSGGVLVSAGGGGGGYTDNTANNNYYSSPRAGSGGTATVDSSAISRSTTNGNNGTASHAGWDYSISVTGGASVYNGYGKATSGTASPPFSHTFTNEGTAGYVRVKFIEY